MALIASNSRKKLRKKIICWFRQSGSQFVQWPSMGGSLYQSLRETNTGVVFAFYLLRGALRKFQRGDLNLVPMPFIHIHPQSSELMSFAPSFSVLWD
jgi:hypothetical protein